MTDSHKETSYFKVGAFVLVGFGLIIFALLIFGTEKVFEPVVYIETYFEESIQGVSLGSPVKYRGLQIGYIDNIAFTSEIYPSASSGKDADAIMFSRSIYVKIAITSKLFTELSDDEVREFLQQEIDQGLRVKLVAKGLTGMAYLEFNYVDPKKNPIHKLEWVPKNFYIPSVASTLARLRESAQYIMNELKSVDFKKLFFNVSSLVDSFEGLVERTDNLLNQVETPTVRAMQNLKVISNDLRVVTDRLKLKPSEIVFSSYPPPLDPNNL